MEDIIFFFIFTFVGKTPQPLQWDGVILYDVESGHRIWKMVTHMKYQRFIGEFAHFLFGDV
jgi:hypothetical protein